MPGESQLYSGQKPVPPEAQIYEYLRNGTHQAVGDYSDATGTGPHELVYTCKQGRQQLCIYRMIVHIEDVGKFVSNRYGYDLVLTEGIHIAVHSEDESERVDLDGSENVFTNAGWGALCYDTRVDQYGTGNATGSLSVRWTFANAGAPISMSAGEHFVVTLNDDFTGLEPHTFLIQGHYA